MINPNNPRVMMGFETAGDQRVPVPVRNWNAMKRALWRSRVGWEITMRAASGIVERCAHAEGCPGAKLEAEPCLQDCPDREQRMDALVILNAARQHAPVDATAPAKEPYSAPSREYFSEVIAELAITQMRLEMLRTYTGIFTDPPLEGEEEPRSLPQATPVPQLPESTKESP